ncbi:hypothetical protein [Azospirillum argentinense]|uniref:Uncharacterized protein n=1 Tax=Azospirillum argentinense TaxID=2970906 RepID=A0A5B0KX24_9PROT|nr:hypothetical protein [Azospirillum argentinense]KAA1056511.1 hypothetical protein FH063_004659 [Azospirillum argentinense]
MVDQTVEDADRFIGEESCDVSGRVSGRVHGLPAYCNSPYFVFPALILLLIMPLSIIFHPSWIVPLAELYAIGMMVTIIRLTR